MGRGRQPVSGLYFRCPGNQSRSLAPSTRGEYPGTGRTADELLFVPYAGAGDPVKTTDRSASRQYRSDVSADNRRRGHRGGHPHCQTVHGQARSAVVLRGLSRTHVRTDERCRKYEHETSIRTPVAGWYPGAVSLFLSGFLQERNRRGMRTALPGKPGPDYRFHVHRRRGRRDHRTLPGRRGFHFSACRVAEGARSVGARARDGLHSGRGAIVVRANRKTVRARVGGPAAEYGLSGQGHRQRNAGFCACRRKPHIRVYGYRRDVQHLRRESAGQRRPMLYWTSWKTNGCRRMRSAWATT